MAGSITVGRTSWLGLRWQQHGLDGRSGAEALEDLLLLGVQDSRQAGAAQSMVQRTSSVASTSVSHTIGTDGPLVRLWSVRGAPHVHPLNRLDVVRDALAPRASDVGGADYAAAVEEVAAALTAVVTGPTSKSTASTEVTARVPATLVEWCARCEAHHVPDALFRAAGRQAQILLDEARGTTVLHPTPAHRKETVDHPRLELLNAYIRVNGPTSRPLFGDWMGIDPGATADLWRELRADLVRVQVDNRRYDLPESRLEALRTAPRAEGVVLVPPHDPYLRQVDRTLLVPDSRRRHQVWRALSAPGALLVDGEVAGTWRYRRSKRRLTVSPFGGLASAQRRKAEQSARLVTAATDDDEPTVSWE